MKTYLTDHRFDTDGVEASVENGVITVSDNAASYELPDTPENRSEAINDVINTVAAWSRNAADDE